MDKYFRISQLATGRSGKGLLPVSPATLWRWVKAGEFPAPQRLGLRCTVWRESDIQAFMSGTWKA